LTRLPGEAAFGSGQQKGSFGDLIPGSDRDVVQGVKPVITEGALYDQVPRSGFQ
jgi:hypothetical protein